MAFCALPPSLSPLIPHPTSPHAPKPPPQPSKASPTLPLGLCSALSCHPKALCSNGANGVGLTSSTFDGELLRRVAPAKDADQALDLIGEAMRNCGGVGELGLTEFHSILDAAFDRGNVDLALSVFYAASSASRRSAFEGGGGLDGWSWAKPDVGTYGLMVRRLAACLRVSDAIKMISYVSRMGVSLGEEVPFGNIVRCPSCMIAFAVAQPQHGIQVVSCHQCRYQYELVSGDIVDIESEEVNIDVTPWDKALMFLQLKKEGIPAAVHSLVVCTPSGTARTHKFATKTAELPAQIGERVTLSLAAPPYAYRQMGPIKLNARYPGYNPGEPMCITNHKTGQISQLVRVPTKNEASLLVNPYFLFPSLALLASGDAASAFIDPTLPRLISVAVVGSAVFGTAVDRLLLPEIRKLPQKMVDVAAIKQQLLAQYDLLQTRISDLRQAAEKETWMLARMCQLENKILAVGETSYRARRSRVKRVRESLESSLLSRIELIESYARISSMIEIEVEMDTDVLAAEAVSNADNISQQIQQIMEIENLDERWRIQAEANDEAERLLSTQPFLNEPF